MGQALVWATRRLGGGRDGAWEARVLLEEVTGLDPSRVVLEAQRPMEAGPLDWLGIAVEARRRGAPLAYVVGHWSFFGLDLVVGPDVLIPRPETERAVEAVLALLSGRQSLRVADLGTGSGAIALAIKSQRPKWTVVGTDTSERALSVARWNAGRLDLGLDLFAWDFRRPTPGRPFDVIVSNPPYIRRGAIARLAASVRRFEPRVALDGGPDGLDGHRALLERARMDLGPGGLLVLEMAFDQAAAVEGLAREGGLTFEGTLEDLAGHRRIAVVRCQRGAR